MPSLAQQVKHFFFAKPNLAKQLAEVCDTLMGLRKLGEYNSGYKYLRILDLANALRGELFQRGILIIPNDLECFCESWQSQEFPDRRWTEYQVHTEFVITDGISKFYYCSYGVGRDMDGKALFIAQTGALKAFLKRLGLIFGEWDDPEVEVGGDRPRREIAANASYQERAWTSALRDSGKTPAQIRDYFTTAFGLDVTSDSITSLPRKDFDVAMKWLLANGDLIDTVQTTLDSLKAKKAKKGPQEVA